MTVIHNELFDEETREVEMPDGSKQPVKATVHVWKEVRFLLIVEGIPEKEITEYALEECSLQPGVTFEQAFTGVVAHLSNRWSTE